MKNFLLFVVMVIVSGCITATVLYVNYLPSVSTYKPAPLEQVDDWQTVETQEFKVTLPPSWEFKPVQGIDSYVGEFKGDGVTLHFDYGWYSDPLSDYDNPDHVVTYETIDGYRAKIVVSRNAGQGTTGVYFEQTGKSDPADKLTVIGFDLTKEQQQTALKIFMSLNFGLTDAAPQAEDNGI